MNKLNKVLFVAALASALVFLAAGCTGSSRNDTATQSGDSSDQKVIQYTCPMHPEVVQDKPGACPKCGMTLVEKREQFSRENAQETQNMKDLRATAGPK